MSKSPAQKMFLKPGYQALALNAPELYLQKMGEMPDDIIWHFSPHSPVDFLHIFAYDLSQAQSFLVELHQYIKEQTLIWISYPKQSSGMKTDINRDSLSQAAQQVGLKSVSLISIDETWSAMRFKIIQ